MSLCCHVTHARHPHALYLYSSAAAIIAAVVILLYVGVSLCQHCATWRFDRRVREAQKRGEISMHSKGAAEMTEDA
jgi:hypothetical protein